MLEKFKKGLNRTREAIKDQFSVVFSKKEIDEEFYEELEETLILADVGVDTTLKIVSSLREKIKSKKLKTRSEALELLKEIMIDILGGEEEPLTIAPSTPTVYLFLGVNGVGKTTTIAKVAHYFVADGKKVLLAAGDTFRAAAIEQLEEWSKLVKNTEIIKHQSGGDPSAVVYDAVDAAAARNVDILLCDTAGRLHTKANLLEEVKKMYRVVNKSLEGAPHETLLVLDATTGQNAIAQASYFQQALPITGIVLAKLDGTARGGIVLGVKDNTGIPVKLIGTGEKLEDLQPFDPSKFVEALLS